MSLAWLCLIDSFSLIAANSNPFGSNARFNCYMNAGFGYPILANL
ncbi:hypothetical protein HMPREF0530_0355 [Lacticaseibacillus paracasei subsp. paracasei ATCC 25302 = DSM 5622 = JCM 8130]|nr:hypothetical protein HMPREF0530_0355 [Lacticaseibacillus paracasei subsp. paracasei ATCC 25302 = DSM 5622 = JCM 8130]